MHLLCPVCMMQNDMICAVRRNLSIQMQRNRIKTNLYVRSTKLTSATRRQNNVYRSREHVCTEARIELMRRERDMETNKPTHTVQGTHARVDRLPVNNQIKLSLNNLRLKKQKKPPVLDQSIKTINFVSMKRGYGPNS